MSPQAAARLIIAMWLISIGIIAWDSSRRNITFPPAYRFGGSALVYSFLLAVAAFPPAAGLAAVWGVAWTFGLAWRVNQSTATSAVPQTFGPANPAAASAAAAN